MSQDLHYLTRTHGVDTVARRIGVTTRNLVDLRSGRTPLNVDHLQRLIEAYPFFDVYMTIERLAEARREKGITSRGVTE